MFLVFFVLNEVFLIVCCNTPKPNQQAIFLMGDNCSFNVPFCDDEQLFILIRNKITVAINTIFTMLEEYFLNFWKYKIY